MTLDSILKDFPNIRLATEADNNAILEFYTSSQLKSAKQDVIYKRGDDFFKFMKEKSRNFLVFILIDDKGIINGIASISYRSGYIDEKLQTIGYLGDLRINLNRKLIRQWRAMYSLFIEHSATCSRRFHCKYYQTALMEENFFSRNNLANNKIQNVHYEPIEKYRMINVVGRILPRFNKLKVSSVCDKDREEVFSLIKEDQRSRQFGFDAFEELDYRLRVWEKFDLSNFYCIKNSEGEVIAATVLWSPESSKQIHIGQIPIFLKIAMTVLSIIPGVHIFNIPRIHKPLKIKYIHQISFRKGCSSKLKSECFKSFLNYFIDLKLDINMLAYCDFSSENFFDQTRGYLSDIQSMGLYSVHHKKSDKVHYPIQSSLMAPSFDMSLV